MKVQNNMLFHQEIRVRYAEVDQMGVVYYGNYATYLEVARVEALRQCGVDYAMMEKEYGIMLPVVSYETKYLRPAVYDDLLDVQSSFDVFDESQISIYSEIYNADKVLLNKSKVKLLYVDIQSRKRTKLPPALTRKLKTYFTS